MRRFVLSAAAIGLLLSACAGPLPGHGNPRPKVGTWIGKSSSDLVAYAGPPATAFDLPDGRKVIRYERSFEYPISGGTARCEANFIVGKDGKIADENVDGVSCGRLRDRLGI